MIAGKLLEGEQYTDSLALLGEIADFPSLAEKSRALVALFSGSVRSDCCGGAVPWPRCDWLTA